MGWHRSDDLAQSVALEVLLHGPLGRSELARRLGLAPATLTRISSDLIAAGILAESGEPTRGRTGRPSMPLDVVPAAHHFVGAKLAGDTITAVLTHLRAEVLESCEARLTDVAPGAVADQLGHVVRSLAGDRTIDGIGIGLGGVTRDARVVASAPFLGWADVPLAELVEGVTGIPTCVANDLTAFTEAQHWFGLGSGHTNFATLTLGVGVGYGCVANGRLLAAPDSGVGLVGHWPLDPLGPPCTRGHRGCAEALLTVPAIERDVSLAAGRAVGWDEVLDMARDGEPATVRILSASGRALGQLIAAVANLTAPELVIIGGEGVGLAETAWDTIASGIAEFRDPRALPVEVRLAPGDNESWCRGSAVMAIQSYVLR